MRRLIYMALKQRLLDSLDWLEYVDYFYMQYTDAEGAMVRRTPSVFIEFMPIDWRQNGLKVQTGTQYIAIHLVSESGYDNEERILDTMATKHFERESQVFAALAGFRPKMSYLAEYASLQNTEDDKQIFESLVRMNTNADHDLTPFLVSVQTFAASIYDYSALKLPAGQVANVTLETDAMYSETIDPPFTNQ